MPDVKRTQHQNETTDQAISPMRPVLSAYRMARRRGCGEAGGGGGVAACTTTDFAWKGRPWGNDSSMPKFDFFGIAESRRQAPNRGTVGRVHGPKMHVLLLLLPSLLPLLYCTQSAVLLYEIAQKSQ